MDGTFLPHNSYKQGMLWVYFSAKCSYILHNISYGNWRIPPVSRVVHDKCYIQHHWHWHRWYREHDPTKSRRMYWSSKQIKSENYFKLFEQNFLNSHLFSFSLVILTFKAEKILIVSPGYVFCNFEFLNPLRWIIRTFLEKLMWATAGVRKEISLQRC